MIAYNWFDCDRQPQPWLINFLTSCDPHGIGVLMDFLPFFQWCYDTSFGQTIRESTWIFPLIEAFHLVGFGLTLGAVLLVDLRLLGAGLSRQPPAQLSDSVQPWLLGGVALMLSVGHFFVHVRIDQVLLQSGILGEDVMFISGPRLHVHVSPSRRANGPDARSGWDWTRDRRRISQLVVWRGLGWALDRVLVIRDS